MRKPGLALLFCSASLLISGCDLHKFTGVQWKDISSWKALGSRWASAYDKDGKRVAIFDLSHLSIRQELELGFLGARQIRVKEAISEIRRAIRENLPVREHLEARVLTRLAAMEAYLKSLERNRNPNDAYDQLPENWWEGLPWKPEALARMTPGREPEWFSLNDFDLESIAKDKKKFREMLAELEETRESTEADPVLGKGFLAALRFKRLSEGGYQMNWVPQPLGVLDQPRKVVDLTVVYSGVVENVVWSTIKGSTKGLIGLLPEPVIKALIQTALGRLFHAHDLMTQVHRGMLIEMGRFADAMPSALSELEPDELTFAESWMTLTDQSLGMVGTFLWRKPDEVWRKNGEKEAKQAGKSHEWLIKHGFEASSITPRFDEAFKDGQHSLFALPYKKSFLSGSPVESLRYERVEATRAYREFIEVLSAAIDFATHFIPLGGGLVNDLYRWTVEDPIDKQKTWEGRLKIALLENPMHSERDWTPELDLLDIQKVDDLELPFREASDLVAARKRQLGIP